jgi:glycosyltransferase involved in cell wall biosynthesis
VLPHDARHRWAEIELARLLADRADLVQVLSESTLDAVAGVYELDRSKVVVIEHSSYVGEYPDWISREAARRRLGILRGEKALIVLGGIRPYKGIDVLLDVFDELVDRDPTLRLLVAGKPSHHEEVAALSERCQQHPRVISSFDYVPDDQLQVWMNAADLAVLPYRDILNSGAFLLAQSFGLPVAAPDAGTLRSWAGQPHVWLFDPTDPASLSSEITAALEDVVLDPDRLRASALAAAQSRTPDQMAAAFAKAVQPLLAPRDLTDARGRARSSRTRASD